MSESADPSGQVPRRTTRSGDGGAPVSGAVAIVLAVVAVVAGFLILNSISDGGEAALDFPADEGSPSDGVGGGDGDGDGDDADADASDDATGSTSTTTTTTTPQIVTEGASVLVANANNVDGSAGEMQRLLEFEGFTVVAAVNASDSVGEIADSEIHHNAENPDARVVAESVAEVIGGVETISPLDTENLPVQADDVQGADVLLILGNDKAGKTINELNPDLAGDGDVSEVTNPPVVGDEDTGVEDTGDEDTGE